jgi:hypothetical protein
VRLAAGLVVVEAAALLGYAGWIAVATLVGSPNSRGLSYAAAGIWLLAGLLLALAAWGVSRSRHWALSPTVLSQLIGVLVGAGLISGSEPLIGVITVALSAGVLFLLFSTAQAREAFRR